MASRGQVTGGLVSFGFHLKGVGKSSGFGLGVVASACVLRGSLCVLDREWPQEEPEWKQGGQFIICVEVPVMRQFVQAQMVTAWRTCGNWQFDVALRLLSKKLYSFSIYPRRAE